MNKFIYSIVILLVIINQNIYAQSVAKFADIVNNITQLQLEFSQISSKLDGNQQTTKGYMYFKKPEQFKFHQTQPFEQIIIINKDVSYIYDVELQQAIKSKANVANTPLYWLLNNSDKVYFTNKTNDIYWYQTAYNNGLQYNFGFTNKQLTNIKFVDTLGNNNNIVFTPMPLKTLSDEDFSLKLDDNIDIINQ